MVIENILKYEILERYTVTVKCKKCHSLYYKDVPLGVFEKLDLEKL